MRTAEKLGRKLTELPSKGKWRTNDYAQNDLTILEDGKNSTTGWNIQTLQTGTGDNLTSVRTDGTGLGQLSPRKSQLCASVTGWPRRSEKRARQSGKALTAVSTCENVHGRRRIWGRVRCCGWCNSTRKGPRMMDSNNGWKPWYVLLWRNFPWLSRNIKWCAVWKSFAMLREGCGTKRTLRRMRQYRYSQTAADRNFANEIVDPLARKVKEYWQVQINRMRPTMPLAAMGTAARRSMQTCILLQLGVHCVEQYLYFNFLEYYSLGCNT